MADEAFKARQKASNQRESGNIAGAIRTLEDYLITDPHNNRVRMELANIYIYDTKNTDFGLAQLDAILDIDPEVGMRRSFAKAENMAVKELRFESRQMDFHRNLRHGFLEIAKREPERCAVVNADTDIETLHKQIVKIVEDRLGI